MGYRCSQARDAGGQCLPTLFLPSFFFFFSLFSFLSFSFLFFFLSFSLKLILEREEGRDKERKRNIDVREKHPLVASCMCFGWGKT